MKNLLWKSEYERDTTSEIGRERETCEYCNKDCGSPINYSGAHGN